ncbi:MAG: PadR family transcriptional regulator [Acidimicrobiales bacterium]
MAARQPSSATANAVLGLLSFGHELSGYDLKKWADHSLRFFFWSPASSQIYSELRRLEERGLVSARVIAKDDTRRRRVYAITEAGRRALAEWLATEPADVAVLKHPTILRVWLGHLMAPEALRTVVDEHRHRLTAVLAEVRHDQQRAAADPAMAYAKLVLDWAERYHRAELANTDRLLAEMDQLEAAGRRPDAARSLPPPGGTA